MIYRLIAVTIVLFGQVSAASAEPFFSDVEFVAGLIDARRLAENDPSKYEEAKKMCQDSKDLLAKYEKNPVYEVMIVECFAGVEAGGNHIKEACGLYDQAMRAYEALRPTRYGKAAASYIPMVRRQTIKLGCPTSPDGKPIFDKKQLEANGFTNPEFVVVDIPRDKRVKFSHEFTLNALMFRNSGWTRASVTEEIKGAAKILAQCNIAIGSVKLASVDDDKTRASFKPDYSTAISRPMAIFEKDWMNPPVRLLVTRGKVCEAIEMQQECDLVSIRSVSLNEPVSKKYRGIALAVGLAYLLAQFEDSSGSPGNIFAPSFDEIGPSISPEQCTAMRQYAKLKPLSK